ncbi:hypothetical protein QF029_002946 [Priestia megaterium]|nr:hypothetical protein [Priestia megaterium]
MWVVTIINAYSRENNISIFEFETEKEAKETYNKLQKRKIFSDIFYCRNQFYYFQKPC